MAWKSYRGHARAGDTGPAGAIVAALCVGLAMASPILLVVAGFLAVWRWAIG